MPCCKQQRKGIIRMRFASCLRHGIAAEYCVKETVLGLLEKGIKVTVLKDCLGYVSEDDYRKSLAAMKEKGAEVL